MKKIIYLILLTLLFFSEVYSDEWQVVRNDSIRVFYMDANKNLAEETIAISDKILNELQSIIKLPFKGDVNIFLANDENTWEKLTHEKLPDWSQAVTKSKTGVVYLLINREDGKSLVTVLRHELFHVLIGKNFSSGIIPRWFEEGTAMLFAKESFSDFTATLSKANITKSLMTLDEIENVLKFQKSKANLAYAESYLGVKMIVDALEWEGIQKILTQVNQNKNWETTFHSILEMDKDQFEWKLFEYIEDHYKWSFILQSEILFWVLLPFIAVLVFISIRLRNYRTIRRWEEEDNQPIQFVSPDE